MLRFRRVFIANSDGIYTTGIAIWWTKDAVIGIFIVQNYERRLCFKISPTGKPI